MKMIKKTALTAVAIATISMAALGASSTDASAGKWKKFHKFGHHFAYGHKYGQGHGYYCKPKYKKLWVWSPRHGRKIKRWVKVGKWCGGEYISLY